MALIYVHEGLALMKEYMKDIYSFMKANFRIQGKTKIYNYNIQYESITIVKAKFPTTKEKGGKYEL